MPRKKPAPTLKARLEALWNDPKCRSATGITVWRADAYDGHCSEPADDHEGLWFRRTTVTPILRKRKCKASKNATRA